MKRTTKNPMASATVDRYNLPLYDTLLSAFDAAWLNFKAAHGHEPDTDVLSLRADFSTTSLVLEIEEMND